MDVSADLVRGNMDEQYVVMAQKKYEEIVNIVSRKNKPTRQEKELISLIFNKMVDPYYYWAEAREKIERERRSKEDAYKSEVEVISEMVKRYDLDTAEVNNDPSRIKLKKYIETGFEELTASMKVIGYSYDRWSRSFVKKR